MSYPCLSITTLDTTKPITVARSTWQTYGHLTVLFEKNVCSLIWRHAMVEKVLSLHTSLERLLQATYDHVVVIDRLGVDHHGYGQVTVLEKDKKHVISGLTQRVLELSKDNTLIEIANKIQEACGFPHLVQAVKEKENPPSSSVAETKPKEEKSSSIEKPEEAKV